MRSVLVLAVATFVVAGCARGKVGWSEILHAEAQGNLDAVHAAVVHLSSGCSGTLVSAARVLTAAHCVTEIARPEVWIGEDGDEPQHRYAVSRCYVHPLAYGTPIDCGDAPTEALRREHDLAILYLAEPIPERKVRPYRALVTSRGSMDRWIDRSVYLVGWHRWPLRHGPLRRYAGEQEVTDVNRVLITQPGDDARAFYTRRGNSGGPAIVHTRGRDIVVGVLSGGSSTATLGPRFSLYAPTFEPSNAVWVRAHLTPQPRRPSDRTIQIAERDAPATGLQQTQD